MKTTITLALLYAIKYSNAIVIRPDTDTSGLGISADLTTDPRSINEITDNNEWKVYQSYSNVLADWYEENNRVSFIVSH